jgi:hypothetical protein
VKSEAQSLILGLTYPQIPIADVETMQSESCEEIELLCLVIELWKLYKRKLFGCNLGEESSNDAAQGLAQLGYPVFIFVCCGTYITNGTMSSQEDRSAA